MIPLNCFYINTSESNTRPCCSLFSNELDVYNPLDHLKNKIMRGKVDRKSCSYAKSLYFCITS